MISNLLDVFWTRTPQFLPYLVAENSRDGAEGGTSSPLFLGNQKPQQSAIIPKTPELGQSDKVDRVDGLSLAWTKSGHAFVCL